MHRAYIDEGEVETLTLVSHLLEGTVLVLMGSPDPRVEETVLVQALELVLPVPDHAVLLDVVLDPFLVLESELEAHALVAVG